MAKYLRTLLLGSGLLLVVVAVFLYRETDSQLPQPRITASAGGTMMMCDPLPGMADWCAKPADTPMTMIASVTLALGVAALVACLILTVVTTRRFSRRKPI
ncbi:hypothetical protein [Actinokineospora sp. HUAS TT18]|uniref:hypothetical protein n=1 Tax=Actinokineospora sp. HUAS TT18 TaxID=3447451 RepID=UPI003F51F561